MLLLLIILLCSHHVQVNSMGYMSIQFVQFSSNGRLSTGALCDPATTSGAYNPCDPQFSLTVERDKRGSDKALLEYKQTNYYINQDVVHFGLSFGELTNPVVVGMNYNDNLGSIWISMEVKDIDAGTTNDRTIAKFSAELKASGTVTEAGHLDLTAGTNQRLSLNYWYACHTSYYGALCNTYCRATNDMNYGHSWCTAIGQKVCLYGWVDASTDCKKPHPCRTCVCKNGGTCVPQAEGFSCLCPPDFSGATCGTCDHRVSKCVGAAGSSYGCDLAPLQECQKCSCPVQQRTKAAAGGPTSGTFWFWLGLVTSALLLNLQPADTFD